MVFDPPLVRTVLPVAPPMLAIPVDGLAVVVIGPVPPVMVEV
jgi:hypothetical protein